MLEARILFKLCSKQLGRKKKKSASHLPKDSVCLCVSIKDKQNMKQLDFLFRNGPYFPSISLP